MTEPRPLTLTGAPLTNSHPHGRNATILPPQVHSDQLFDYEERTVLPWALWQALDPQ